MAENSVVGKTVLTILADDADSGTNKEVYIKYHWLKLFVINGLNLSKQF